MTFLLPLRILFAGMTLAAGSDSFAQSPPPAPSAAMAEKLSTAKPGEVRVFATAAMLALLQAVRADAQSAIKRPVRIEYGSARGNLKTKILADQSFEVALLLPDVTRELRAQGKIDSPDYPVALIPIAVGIRGDVPNPDVSSPQALKAALLKARWLKYAKTGAAGDTVSKVLSTLNIANRVAIRITDNSAIREVTPLGPGEYEITLFPISDVIVQGGGLRNLGMVPSPLQVPARVVAVIGRGADVAGARAFIEFMKGPAVEARLTASNMVKPR